jgi:hypothetical protein
VAPNGHGDGGSLNHFEAPCPPTPWTPGSPSRIAAPEATVRDLQARLQLNSTNSSKPPSSDPIGPKRKPPSPPSRRKRGGQPGHRKAFRALVPPENLRSSTDCKPDSCRRCGHAPRGTDPASLIHRVAELPRIEPVVDEYRFHRLNGPVCGATTCASRPEGVPAGHFGPYTQAVLAILAGADRLSKRQIRHLAGDLLGLPGCRSAGASCCGCRGGDRAGRRSRSGSGPGTYGTRTGLLVVDRGRRVLGTPVAVSSVLGIPLAPCPARPNCPAWWLAPPTTRISG